MFDIRSVKLIMNLVGTLILPSRNPTSNQADQAENSGGSKLLRKYTVAHEPFCRTSMDFEVHLSFARARYLSNSSRATFLSFEYQPLPSYDVPSCALRAPQIELRIDALVKTSPATLTVGASSVA